MSNQLGINPAMDKLARDNGLGHWSCTDPMGCFTWVRSDGHVRWVGSFERVDSIQDDCHIFVINELRMFDRLVSIGKDWQRTPPVPDMDKQAKAKRMLLNLLVDDKEDVFHEDFICEPESDTPVTDLPEITDNIGIPYLKDGLIYANTGVGGGGTGLPEKTIESKGCNDCPFSNRIIDNLNCTLGIRGILHYVTYNERHPQCPLLTNSIKVVKNG